MTLTSPAIPPRAVFADIAAECAAQHRRWGEQHHPTGAHILYRPLTRLLQYLCDRAQRRGRMTWRHILLEEVCEALAEPRDPAAMRGELVQSAAVLATMIADLDSRTAA